MISQSCVRYHISFQQKELALGLGGDRGGAGGPAGQQLLRSREERKGHSR